LAKGAKACAEQNAKKRPPTGEGRSRQRERGGMERLNHDVRHNHPYRAWGGVKFHWSDKEKKVPRPEFQKGGGALEAIGKKPAEEKSAR